VAELAGHTARLSWPDLAIEVQDRALLVLFDTLGVMLAGAATPEVQALATQHPEPGSAPLAGLGRRTTADASCWVNGASLCCLELDEGSKYARGHPAAHVVPAALAVGSGHPGSDWLTAVIAGYEVAARFGRATRLHSGVHPHGTWGAAGAAAAVSTLRGLGAEGIAAAVDAACGLALAPHFDSAVTGHPVRNLWVGAANVAGLAASRLAASGSGRVSGTAAGTLGEILGVFDPAPLRVPHEERFEIMLGYFKRHAACAYTHSAADAVLGLLETEPIDPDEVTEVRVETYRASAVLDSVEWPTRLAAMFSVPYVVAVTALEGSFGPAATDEAHRTDPRVRRLAERVKMVASEEFESRLPDRRGARVSVVTRHESTRRYEVEQPIGDSGYRPLGWNEIRDKVGDLIGAERAQRLERAIRSLPDEPVESLLAELERS
jgi:2-methylcitrate dehydratase PrpD